MCSEAGEVAGKVKKLARDYGGVMTGELRQEIKKELGDTLWYIAAVCDELQLTLNDVAVSNIAKLHDRQQRKCIGGDGDNR
ncbi:MAG: nucleoside triphosphate pyrophosphohydrolase family protein [Clostridia bacterium]